MTVHTATLVSIQVGQPRDYDGSGGDARPWRSAIHKLPVAGPVWCGRTNIAGDAQANTQVHGGPDKAVLSYSADHYPRWRDELGVDGMSFGGFGENLSITGIAEATVCIGDRWSIGDVILEVSQPRGPCAKIAKRWGIPDLTARVLKTRRPGWYSRVIREGMIAPGPAHLVERPFPRWTIEHAMELMYERDSDLEAARELSAVPVLATSWADGLRKARGLIEQA